MNKNDADAPNIASPAPWQGTLTRFSVPLMSWLQPNGTDGYNVPNHQPSVLYDNAIHDQL